LKVKKNRSIVLLTVTFYKNECDFMYKTNEAVSRIKEEAKKKGIKISDMLISCDLNINTLSSMNNRGSWIQANSLAKIADYLDVSVDYLLGREENPEKKYDATINQVAEAFSKLSFSDKAKVMSLIAELSEKNDK